MANKKDQSDDTLQDLNEHGLRDVIPPGGEYYTLDLKRGNDTDVNDLPELDVAGNDPLSDDEDNDGELVENPDQSTSSNAGGTIRQKDIINQSVNSGVVAGEPGHWGIDEDTG